MFIYIWQKSLFASIGESWVFLLTNSVVRVFSLTVAAPALRLQPVVVNFFREKSAGA